MISNALKKAQYQISIELVFFIRKNCFVYKVPSGSSEACLGANKSLLGNS